MKYFACFALFVCTATLAVAGPKGTVPKASASGYAEHIEENGTAIGATLLLPREVRKTFVSDVNRCCTVVEIALYPSKAKALEISLNDFVLRVKGTETASKPSSAKVAASTLQRKAASDRDVTVSPSLGVGYESGGYDPLTGSRGGGVYRQAGVGVGIGNPGPNPGSTDKDRSVMETELSEKGLPEGQTSKPIAGYIYFPIKDKRTIYQLEYILDGRKVLLALP
jgi:hypothetical protein